MPVTNRLSVTAVIPVPLTPPASWLTMPCLLCCAMLCFARPRYAMLCHAVPPSMLCMLWKLTDNMTDLLDLLLVGAAVNGPGGLLVVKPVCNLIKPLFQAVPVSSQASQHPIEVVTGCFHLDLPVVQITQACPGNKPYCCAGKLPWLGALLASTIELNYCMLCSSLMGR